MSFPGVAPSGHLLASNGSTYQYVVLSGDIAGIAHDTILSRLFGAPVDTSATPSDGLFLGYDGDAGQFTLLAASGSGGGTTTIFPTGLIIGIYNESGILLRDDVYGNLRFNKGDWSALTSGVFGGIIWDEMTSDGVLLKRSEPTTLRVRNGIDTADGNLVVNNLTVNGSHNISAGAGGIGESLIWIGW